MEKKPVFVVGDYHNLLGNDLSSEGYRLVWAYKANTKFMVTCLRELWLKTGLPFEQIWFTKELKGHKGIIIIFEAMIPFSYLRWFKLKNPEARIILWYWKMVNVNKMDPVKIKELGIEVWTFEEKDSRSYAISYNTTFFCRHWYKGLDTHVKPKYDIVFFGRDSDRYKEIMQWGEKFREMGISFYTYITANHVYQHNKKYKPFISMKEILSLELEAKSVLEIVKCNQSGGTLRSMDSMVFQKKLITNNKSIVNEKYYSPDNIFILGQDDLNELQSFLAGEYKRLPEKIVDYYSFDSWVKRFY